MSDDPPDDPPRYLYKFRSLAAENPRKFTRAIIVDGVLWHAQPSSFNDPFDCLPVITGPEGEEKLRYLKRLHAEHRAHEPRAVRRRRIKQMMQRPLSEFLTTAVLPAAVDRVGVVSLSAGYEQVLMWTHYADEHRGICLRFSTKGAPFKDAYQVIYSAERPVLNVARDGGVEYFEKALLTKADFWRYEQEYRTVNRTPGAQPYDQALLTGVILGARITSEDRAAVLDWLHDRPDVEIIQAVIHPGLFRLSFETVRATT
ncbi:DUF2971 domain-containing protein [Salinarimonas soli]|uniref:DUF2971 domain-containing protein n=1 Tax=Salinarimonas soli TaxID=1638099 RepID=A0A5B2VAX8_9HYPH|nr:DUF2971 domain-containing protein [Salinarimonas soli]KAA2235590.1 DUF2971 domain-containing protein [Salinarimonas soli]